MLFFFYIALFIYLFFKIKTNILINQVEPQTIQDNRRQSRESRNTIRHEINYPS